MGGDMGSPIFDATFGTGRFKNEEPMTTAREPIIKTNKDAPAPNVEAALAQPDAKSQNVHGGTKRGAAVSR
jgi:hypothetical protein